MLAVVDAAITLLSIFEMPVDRFHHVTDISSRLLDVDETSMVESRSLDER